MVAYGPDNAAASMDDSTRRISCTTWNPVGPSGLEPIAANQFVGIHLQTVENVLAKILLSAEQQLCQRHTYVLRISSSLHNPPSYMYVYIGWALGLGQTRRKPCGRRVLRHPI